MSWIKQVDPIIKDYLSLQVKEANKFRNAYLKSNNPANAQVMDCNSKHDKAHIFSGVKDKIS